MGKGLLIVVFGMSVIISYVILQLHANSAENLSTTLNMFEHTQSRLIANSGIEIYLEKLKEDMSMVGNTYSDNSLFNGEYDITISGPDSALMVTSTSTFMNVPHKSVAVVRADRLPFFPSGGALHVSTESMSDVMINGNIFIDGNNHDMEGNLLDDGINVPGITVETPEQVQIMLDNIGGNAIIDGTGGPQSIHVSEEIVNWEEYALNVESNPDIIINSGTDLTKIKNLGTISQPLTTFINGDIAFGSNMTGSGILVVNGNLTIHGNFTYSGLIIAYIDSEISTTINGNGLVIGSMVVAGESANLKISNGTFQCLYSLEMLSSVGMLIKAKRFEVLSWWE
jgi:hypothetical protein